MAKTNISTECEILYLEMAQSNSNSVASLVDLICSESPSFVFLGMVQVVELSNEHFFTGLDHKVLHKVALSSCYLLITFVSNNAGATWRPQKRIIIFSINFSDGSNVVCVNCKVFDVLESRTFYLGF